MTIRGRGVARPNTSACHAEDREFESRRPRHKKMEPFLEMLFKTHKAEYTEAFLYVKEANLFKDKIINGESMSDIFNQFSGMELVHADLLADKIRTLGKVASWDFQEINIPDSLNDVLKLHVERETQMYKFYQDLIKINDDKHFEIILKGIANEEKLHLETALKYLKKEIQR